MVSMGYRAIALVQVLQLGVCSTFRGRIENVPGSLDVLKDHNLEIPNVNSIQNRINVELTNVGGEDGFKTLRTPVNKKYEFEYKDLSAGEYELVVNSYDFELRKERFRVEVLDNDTILAYDHPLTTEGYNESSQVVLESADALPIVVSGTREFYQFPQNTLKGMVLNSPFGFIFRNRIFTIIFTICVTIMATPYILSWVNPEFAEQFQDIQSGALQDQKEKQQVNQQAPNNQETQTSKKIKNRKS